MTTSPRRGRARAIAAPTMALAVAAVVMSGCGSKAGQTATATTASSGKAPATTATTSAPVTTVAPAAPGAVTIKDYDFVPTATTVKAGTTVTWTNTDTADHWVVSAPASPEAFDLGRQRTGATVTHTFSKPGTYPYYCNLHNYMKGTVVVP